MSLSKPRWCIQVYQGLHTLDLCLEELNQLLRITSFMSIFEIISYLFLDMWISCQFIHCPSKCSGCCINMIGYFHIPVVSCPATKKMKVFALISWSERPPSRIIKLSKSCLSVSRSAFTLFIKKSM